MFPLLQLLKQTSLCEEYSELDGEQRLIHTVVKNSPFCVTFGFANSSSFQEPLDLHKYNIDINLLYDADTEKEVDFIKTKPIQFKSTINPNGTKLTLEIRIKVLTSQLEDMLFRVGVKVIDPLTKEVTFTALSDAIRVISKSDQVKKKRLADEEASPTPKKKRNVADSIGESLVQIEARQEEQAELLEQAFEKLQSLQRQIQDTHKSLLLKEMKLQEEATKEFQVAFKDFVSSFSTLPQEDKRTKIAKVILATSDLRPFAEFADLVWAEGLSREIPNRNSHAQPYDGDFGALSSCCCEGCPHKKELKRIESFYNDIFSAAQ